VDPICLPVELVSTARRFKYGGRTIMGGDPLMLAIAGGKGGCGKTTTTLGIAAALGRAGRRVLAIDADRDMPDLHVAAGVPGEPTAAAIADGEPVSSVVHPVPRAPRVGVVPAAPGVSRRQLRAAIECCRTGTTVGLIDCPGGAGSDAVAPLRAADAALLVTTDRPASLRDAAKTAAVARTLETPIVGTVVTRRRSIPDGADRLTEADAVATGRVTDPLSPEETGAYREIAQRIWQELFSGSAR